MSEIQQTQSSGFKDLLYSMMTRRWLITLIVLLTFFGIVLGIGFAIVGKAEIQGEWKELLLLLLGAFIGSYGKIIDYWFSDTDKDKMLVQKMDEEDGVSLSNTGGAAESGPISSTPIVPESFTAAINSSKEETSKPSVVKVEIDEDGDGVMDGYDTDGDGVIDEYFEHRQCQHVWGDSDNDGDLECLVCGKIKDDEPEEDSEG